ncbi:MAG: H-NS histone family protein [Cytophagales bacterium]|nr:H-NS histone family protein [Cytophagales bacterium]
MQTYEQIQAQIATVQAQAEMQVAALTKQAVTLRKEAASAAIKEVKRLITMHQLTASDIGLSADAKALKLKKSVGDNRAAVAPKFRDAETGNTWSGRGKPPTWLALKMAAGASKDSFRI